MVIVWSITLMLPDTDYYQEREKHSGPKLAARMRDQQKTTFNP